MGYYIHTVIVFVIGNTIRKAVVTIMIGNYIHRVVVIEGSLFSRENGICLKKLLFDETLIVCQHLVKSLSHLVKSPFTPG